MILLLKISPLPASQVVSLKTQFKASFSMNTECSYPLGMSFVSKSSEPVIHNPNSCLLYPLYPGYLYTEYLLSVCPSVFFSNPPPTLSTLASFLSAVARSYLKASVRVFFLSRTLSLQIFTWLLSSHHSDLLFTEASQRSPLVPASLCHITSVFISLQDSSVPILQICSLECKLNDSRVLVSSLLTQ